MEIGKNYILHWDRSTRTRNRPPDKVELIDLIDINEINIQKVEKYYGIYENNPRHKLINRPSKIKRYVFKMGGENNYIILPQGLALLICEEVKTNMIKCVKTLSIEMDGESAKLILEITEKVTREMAQRIVDSGVDGDKAYKALQDFNNILK